MAVKPQNLVEQFLAEAVHDRHDDDQRGDAEHDAEERKAGDDGNEAFLAPRPQIAPGQQPFEWRKRWGSNWLAHGFNHSSISIRFGLILAMIGVVFGPQWINRHEVSRARASAGLTNSRDPSLRRLISTLPSASPFGPTMTCQGMPIRSAVANFAPARVSVSSYKTSTPLTVSS